MYSNSIKNLTCEQGQTAHCRTWRGRCRGLCNILLALSDNLGHSLLREILDPVLLGEVPGVVAELDDGDQHPGGGVSVAPVAPRLLL